MPDTKDLEPSTATPSTTTTPAALPADLAGIDLPPAFIAGLLATFENRAGDFGPPVAIGLMRGKSLRQSAIAVGLTSEAIHKWMREDDRFRAAVIAAEAVGASRYESELERRALAGSDDRGSIRALELVTKARMPEYREKTQVQMDITHRAESAVLDVVGDWRDST